MSGSPTPPQPRPAAALLADRTFGPWFVGLLLSNSGNWLYNVTAAVVVYNITGSALLVGLVTIAQYTSLALLSLWAGALSDRFDRRRIVLVAQSFAATCATAIAVASLLFGAERMPGGEWAVIATTLGIGTGVAFATPSLQALVPSLVPDADLEMGVALTSLTFNVGRALGPATGGILLATLGAEVAFVANAVSFLALITALSVIRPRPPAHRPDGDRSVLAAVRYVRTDPALAGLLLGITAIGISTDPVNTLAAPLAAHLGGGDDLVAFLVSSFGLGAVLVALAVGRLMRIFGVLPVAATGTTVMSLGLLTAGFSPGPRVAILAFLVTGSGFMVGLTSFTTGLQRRVTDDLRGRVMALWSIAFLGTRPVGAFVDGAAADLLGVQWAFLVPACVALAGALAAGRVRRIGGVDAPRPGAGDAAGRPRGDSGDL